MDRTGIGRLVLLISEEKKSYEDDYDYYLPEAACGNNEDPI